MVRVKEYIDANVLDEAKKRIRHLYDMFDSVVVSFSGGKDSLAVLHLCHEIQIERHGPDATVDVTFYDEELIPQSVISFVDGYRQLPWVNMAWLAVPMRSQKFILGEVHPYIQWDPDRKWIRPKPEWAITDVGQGSNAITQYEVELFVGRTHPGRVAVTNGIRAAESLIRFRSCVSKLSENYINKGATLKTSFCKPIFDWQQKDVFRYFYDRGILYAPLYDRQIAARTLLRVATPLHAEDSKTFEKWRRIDPDFYDQIIDVFPEMIVQEKYWSSLQRGDDLDATYGLDYEGVYRYITDKITDPVQRQLARKRIGLAIQNAHSRGMDSFQPSYLLRVLVNGGYKRSIMPENQRAAASRKAKTSARED